MLNILFLTPIQQGSGNIATASRIINGLKIYFKNIFLENSNNFKTYDQIIQKISFRIDLVILVHAYHSGRLFYQHYDESKLPPLITIFGGTDIHSPNLDWSNIIKSTISLSRFLVCFSEDLMVSAVRTYPYCRHKCVVIPQGVYVSPKQDFQLLSYVNANNLKVVSWVGSIRKVKDPLYIESVLKDIYLIDKKICFIYAGYSLDDSLVKSLKHMQFSNKNFYYINGLNDCEAHAFIRSSWAFINTSINEGMSLAVLEAMKLKVPVIVRKNFGNCSLVKHKVNGLVFENKNDFIENILDLLNNDDLLREKIVFNAFNHVNERHSCEKESVSYYNCILNSLDQS
jgi:glycosyltransferase involved in cell wall biosynthesis